MSSEPLDERILDLLARWSAAREAGQQLSVDELCKDCPELIDHVRPRLAALEEMQWLECSDSESLPPTSPDPLHRLAETIVGSASPATIPRVGTTVRYLGDYELLEELGRGGMGVVYKARQVLLKRTVAVKMLLARDFATPADLQRFHTEAESAAQLDHPAIVPVFEVGEYQGLHYFSMGFIDGQPLSARLIDGPLPPREAALLLKTVSEGVQYAHDKGVIHRDLKPGNILIDRAGNPRVADFGLAKRTQMGASDLTGTGQILGTPSYMPPEQAIGQPSLVREAADIYALGAVLYALLTGRPPFQADSPMETLRQVLERDPVSPRQLNPRIPLDLETICLKCLEKSSARRYVSAQHLADELCRFLEGKPLLARPVGPLSRAWRWCKRNRAVAILLAAVSLSLIIGTVVSSYFAYESNERAIDNLKLARHEKAARDDADKSARVANFEAANLALNQAEARCEAGEANVGLLWMVKAHRLANAAGDHDLADACRAMISGWLSHVPRLEKVYSQVLNTGARFGPNDKTIIIARNYESDRSLHIVDAQSGETVFKQAGIRLPGPKLAFNTNRELTLLIDAENRFRIWSLIKQDWIGKPLPIDGSVSSADFSPDGTLLATATTEGHIQFWDIHTGMPSGTDFVEPQDKDLPHCCCVQFVRGSKSVWVGGSGKCLVQRKVADGSLVRPRAELPYGIFSLAATPQGNRLVLGDMTSTLRLLDSSQQELKELAKATSQLEYEIAFHPDRQHVIAGGRGVSNGARFWNLKYFDPVGSSLTASSTVTSLQLSANGDRALVCNLSGVETWRTPLLLSNLLSGEIPAHAHLAQYCFAKMQIITAAQGGNQSIAILSVVDGSTIASIGQFEYPIRFLATDELGRIAVIVDQQKRVIVVDLERQTFQIATTAVSDVPDKISVSPTANHAWMRMPDGQLQVWNLTNCTQLTSLNTSAIRASTGLAYNESGNKLAILDTLSNQLHIIDLETESPVRAPFVIGESSPLRVQFHPDGQHILVDQFPGKLELWDWHAGQRVRVIGKHDSFMETFAVSSDGRYVTSAGVDQVIRTWDLKNGTLAGTPVRNVGRVYQCEFSPDSRLIAFYSPQLQVRIVHARTGRIVSPKLEHRGTSQACLRFTKDCSLLFSALYKPNSSPIRHLLLKVPETQRQLELFVETWTGLTLDGNDVRVLPRDEWKKRLDEFVASGWKDVEPPRIPFASIPVAEASPALEIPDPLVIDAGIEQVRRVVYSGDGTRLAVAGIPQTKVWETATRNLVREFPSLSALAVCLTRDGKQMLTGGGRGLAWSNVETGEIERTIKPAGTIIDIALSPDEQLVAIVEVNDHKVRVLRRDKGEILRTLELPIVRPNAQSGKNIHSQVSFSPDGKLLIVSCGGRIYPELPGVDSAIAIFEVASWKLRSVFTTDQYCVRSLSISPDSQWIGGACHGGRTVKIWKMPSSTGDTLVEWKPAKVFESPSPHLLNATMFSPSGNLLAYSTGVATRGDIVLKRLDSESSFLLPTLDGAEDLAFSPDGKQLATASHDGKISFWDMSDLDHSIDSNATVQPNQ